MFWPFSAFFGRKKSYPVRRKDARLCKLVLEVLEDRVVPAAPWTAIGPAPIINGQISGNGPVSGRITGIPDIWER